MKINKLYIILLIFYGIIVSSRALADSYECGSFIPIDGIGPWDYYDPKNWVPVRGSKHGHLINLVESAHFTSNVENLISGQSGPIANDIDYTLKRIPNHPRALLAVSRFQREGRKSTLPNDPKYTVDCYFDRAIRFRPKNATTHMLYAIHLHKVKNYVKAEKEYLISESLNPDDPEIHYNMGLFYYDRKQYKKAKYHAKKAYAKHYPLPGLKNKLKKINAWP